MSKDFWNGRYAENDLVYGEEANDFLVHASDRFPKSGRALDLAAGEGRNALFLAAHGLDVLAVDQSDVGMKKARVRAQQRGVPLATQAADLATFDTTEHSFDVISSIFVHVPTELRSRVHARVVSWLKPDGLFVLEAYAPDQITRDTGGPKDPALLASLDVIVSELEGLEIEHAESLVRSVNEGAFHTGEASVVQVIARRG